LQTIAEIRDIKISILKALAMQYIVFFKGAFQNNLSISQLGEDLSQFGLTQQQIELVSALWAGSLHLLNNSSLSQTLMVNELVLPEWRFGVTRSNKDLRTVNTTFLQLKLNLDKGNGETNVEYVELTLPQFYQFLASLEKAKAQLDFFS